MFVALESCLFASSSFHEVVRSESPLSVSFPPLSSPPIHLFSPFFLGVGGVGSGGKQVEIQHILEASNAQKTVHDSANSKGVMTELFSDPRVSIERWM